MSMKDWLIIEFTRTQQHPLQTYAQRQQTYIFTTTLKKIIT
jgi:hypothetical protein